MVSKTLSVSNTRSPAKYEDELVGGEGWGRKKKYFYGGNPNERRPWEREPGSGQEEEEEDEAELEARESRKLQAKQLASMDEEDFVESFAIGKVCGCVSGMIFFPPPTLLAASPLRKWREGPRRPR